MNTPEVAYKEMIREAKSYKYQGNLMKRPARSANDISGARSFTMAYLHYLGERIDNLSSSSDFFGLSRHEHGGAYDDAIAEIEKLEQKLQKLLPDFK